MMPRRLARFEPGLAVAWAMAFIFAGLFGWLSIRQHNGFGTMAFDLGIYDQGFWLVSRGKSFDTVRGLDFWGHHLNLIAFAYAPFYWLGAGARFLLATQALVLGVGAVPTYLIARRCFASQGVGIIFAWLYLLYPPVQWLTHANFHPEALAVTPLLFMWWYLGERRWRPFAISAAIALSMREDVALALVVLGVVMMIVPDRGRGEPSTDTAAEIDGTTPRRRWSRSDVGLLVLLGAGWYYFAATNMIIPHFNNGRQPFYVNAFYGEFGQSGTEVALNLARRPDRLVADAAKPDRLSFYADLLAPWGWLPLAGPAALLTAVPQLVASTIANISYVRSIRYQYTAVMIAPITVAAIEGLARLRRLLGRRSARARRVGGLILIGWVTLSMATASVTASPAPWSRNAGDWWRPGAQYEAIEAAIGLIPPDESVSALYVLVPHLAHRSEIYVWPNPWIEENWGVGDSYRLPDPDSIEWIILVKNGLGVADREIYEGLAGLQFEIVYELAGVVVLHRRPADNLSQ